ncbi:cellobionic acid phosphorylase [Palleronia marisminoris]|uniref:N,N'-diacetylchitobiose phosphorylase n=1 Tax=Palleronia marisminoris TaxID=315423 RepID=A0A1Y5SBH9_9RHOB|nr:glycosyl hydrolase family 65 protein [Palleronia marisminoris]SFG68942.1 cellobionic acid phosphorylase [Palleronia marisminoris]SLN35361.1 N,N'-diacetylchitobiose phosphorylase [Palleronia marisminoris]
MAAFIENGNRFRLTDPTLAPAAAGYLWNRRMMIQMTCRGYAVSQYMDPEPRKYAHAPTLAAQTFMQPEHRYFAHHPGRFFYVRDDRTGALFSAPHEPVRATPDSYAFEPGLSDIRWVIEKNGIRVELCLELPVDDAAEIWSAKVSNIGKTDRDVAFVPYFPVGYMSWMNMGGHFDAELGAVVCTSVTPYQAVEDYFKNRHLKDITFLAADRTPDYFEVSQQAFEDEGGLADPSALQAGGNLAGGDAAYEIPAGIMQWNLTLPVDGSEEFRFVFGPAHDKAEIAALAAKYLRGDTEAVRSASRAYVDEGLGSFEIESPDAAFDAFVNRWLPRQVFYHGDTNRLTTDPQTRNYLQDALGMVFIRPETTRAVILRAASQQFASGKVPDGILLNSGATLKYINQIPHTDHAVWLVIATCAYLDETNDRSILDEQVAWIDSEGTDSLYDHVTRALRFLAGEVDERGLPLIAQGDWCDPMNMVGYKGKGVSGWLAEASSYAMSVWAEISESRSDSDNAKWLRHEASAMVDRINAHLWDGDWYARGITDDGVPFGVSADEEGRIYLNAQSWALLCGAADDDQKARMLSAIDDQLATPYGIAMFAPAYTKMREDVGRLTQKWPGSAENGAVYNHAAAFYAAALYHISDGDRAYRVLRAMLTEPAAADIAVRGQLPLYIPNYYRGAYHQFPRTAGRSSNLFNTGTASWFYRLVIEQMCGLRGAGDAVVIAPQIPSEWDRCRFRRTLRGATFDVSVERVPGLPDQVVEVDGQRLDGTILRQVEHGRSYDVKVKIPSRVQQD